MGRTDKIELFRSPATGDWWWRFRRSNGAIVATSAEGYRRPGVCRTAAVHVTGGLVPVVTVDQ